MLSSVLCLVFKSMKALSFDSPVETNVVRRFPTSAKVFVSASARTRTRNLPRAHKHTHTQTRAHTYIYYIWSLGSIVGVAGGPRLLFLFYVNVSGMRPWSRLPSHPLTIPAPWVLLRVRGSVPLDSMVPPWVTTSCFLVENREAELKPTTFS